MNVEDIFEVNNWPFRYISFELFSYESSTAIKDVDYAIIFHNSMSKRKFVDVKNAN